MTFKKFFFLILAVSLSLVSCKVKKQNAVELTTPEIGTTNHVTSSDITEDDIHWHISVLASDSLRGRKAGTVDEAHAAEYIKNKFKSLGLKAFNENYFQKFPVSSRRYFNNCELYFGDFKGEYPEDFRSMIMFDSLTVAGNVVFAGYGNNADFANLDMKGKWVMVLEGENSILYETKATVKANGALGLLAVGIDGTTGNERYVLSSDSVPLIRISYKLADSLLAHAGTNVQEVISKAKQAENQNINIPVLLTATIKSKTQGPESQNVVSLLETNNPEYKNSYIVIGAHYDHLGTIMHGDTMLINHGADDNASGTAGVLEIAEKLSSGKPLKYNVIFVAFGAEEVGLIGSQYFCNHPPVPIENIKLMVNMDMIGRMDSVNDLYINTIEPNEKLNAVVDLIKKTHPGINAIISPDAHYRSTDHYSFYNKHVPVISFITGLHKDYHTPRDTVGAINFKGEKRILDFIYDFVISPATDDCIRSFTSSSVKP